MKEGKTLEDRFFTREEGVKIVDLLENLHQYCALQQKLIVLNRKLINELKEKEDLKDVV